MTHASNITIIRLSLSSLSPPCLVPRCYYTPPGPHYVLIISCLIPLCYREFALKALEAERHGHRLEADARARASLEAHRQAEIAAAEERKQTMLAASLKVIN